MKLKALFGLLISFLPFNFLRIFFYRTFLRYNISYDSKIGIGNIICCKDVTILKGIIQNFNYIYVKSLVIKENSIIGKFNKFLFVNEVTLNSGSIIVSRNSFTGSRKGISPFKDYENLIIGKNTIITRKHSFDISDTITIGEDVTFAGSDIQVWTHGFDLNHTKIQSPVCIGDHCYIGSRVIILAGISVTNYVSIGAGTVITKPIFESGFYVSSVLMKKSETNDYSSDKKTITYRDNRFLRKEIKNE